MGLTALKQAGAYRDGTEDEVRALHSLVSRLPPDPVIINIGAGNRAISTLAMLENRLDAFIFSIDVKVKENEGTYLRKASLPEQRVVRVLGRSQDVGTHWPLPVDLVYVDGDHSPEGVEGDIMAWLDKVRTRPRGIMAFHDYVDLEGKPTPASRAIDELMAGYEEILRADRIIAFWQEGEK